MITANGKNVIKRFLANQVGQIAESISFGVGSASATVNDTRLQYEIIRLPIVSVNVDPNTDRIVFRTTMQPGQIKTVYEVGLWSSTTGVNDGYTLAILGNSPNTWTNGTLTNTNARANANVLQVNYVANGTTNAELSGFYADASRFYDVDSVVVGYYATTNLSSVRIRLGSDSNNYYELLLPAPVANSYNVARVARSTAVKTGNPDWSRLTYIAVRPSATTAGSGSIFFDGLRFESNSVSDTNILVARSVLSTPHSPDTEIESDIEFSLGVTIS